MKKSIIFVSVLIFSCFFTGCRDMLKDINSISAETNYLESLKMIEVYDVENSSGLSPFKINTYETTYLLWYEIYSWALENGFSFVKRGVEGNTELQNEPDVHALLPATSLHPSDIFVWCNALSVKKSLEPVYYTDEDCTKVLINACDISNKFEEIESDVPVIDINEEKVLIRYDYSVAKTFYQKVGAEGYRIPTVQEWQYAAQGARRTKEDAAYNFSGSNDYKEVAACTQMKIPGSLKANGIGAYDMSGNVCEYSVSINVPEDTTKSIPIYDSLLHCYGGHWCSGKSDIYSVKKLYDLKGIIATYPNCIGFRLAQGKLK